MEPTPTATLSSQGQLSIPAKIRTLLNLSPKDKFFILPNPATRSVTFLRQNTIEESLAELDKLRENLSPETKALIKKNAGKTASQLREEWDNSPEGQKHYQEKYFNHD